MKRSKQIKSLESRQKDYDEMKKSTRHELKVGNRIESGGFHRPGSNKK